MRVQRKEMILRLVRAIFTLIFGSCFCCTTVCTCICPMITLLVLGIVLSPISINADIILNEAGGVAQSLANAYNDFGVILNDLLFCINPLIDFYNRLVSGVFSLANIIAVKAGATSPWGWASRDFHLRTQERELARIDMRVNLRDMEARTFNVDDYESIPPAFKPHIDARVEHRIDEHFRQIDAEERSIFPIQLCNLVTFVSDLAINIIDILLPFIRALVGAIVEAIVQSNGDPVNFIVVLVKFIIVELLKLIPFGYCLADIPYSILGCICFNVSPPYPTDVPTFIGRCFFSGFCDSSTLDSANTIIEIFFKCLHLDTLKSAVDAILGAVNSAISFVSGAISTINGFISSLSNFQGDLAELKDIIDIVRGALGLRGSTDAWLPADDVLLQVRTILTDDNPERALLLHPMQRAGATLWTIYKCITFFDENNKAQCITNRFSSGTDGLVVSDDKIARITTLINTFYNDRNLAAEDVIDDLRDYMQRGDGSPAMTIDFAERVAAIMHHKLVLVPTIAAREDANEMRVLRYIAQYYNVTLRVDNTPYTPPNMRWLAAPTFDERFDALLEENPGNSSAHALTRSVQSFIGRAETRSHIANIGLLGAHVANVFVWLLSTETLPPMDEIMLRMGGEYCEDLTDNPFGPDSHCHPDIYENAFASLAHMADASRATHNISRGDEFAARMVLHKEKRWASSDRKMSPQAYADFETRTNAILEKRTQNARDKVFTMEKRFIVLVGIAAGGVIALIGVGAVPLVAGVALLPILIAALLPLLIIVLPLFPFILQFLMHMAIGLIGNMLNGGAYEFEDYITPFFINVGPYVLDLFKEQATIGDIQNIASITATTAVEVLDSIGAYVLQQITCLIPPLFGLTCAVSPPPGSTTASYFNLVIYSNIYAPCVADVGDGSGNFGCTLGSRCRAPDPSGPHPDAQRSCTAENPCYSPMGVCIAWPLIPSGIYLPTYQVNITYDVSTEPYPAEGVKYYNSASFKNNGLSWRYLFSSGFFSWMWACMLCVYYAGRDVLRIVIVTFEMPPQVLIFGSLLSLPLIPGVLGILRPLGFFSWTVPARIQTAALAIIPVLVWIENSPFVWITTAFGGPNLATWALGFLRWPNYLDSPPFGSATAAVYINLVRFLPFIMIGVDFWIIWAVILFCFIFFGGLEILVILLCILVWPIKYALTSKNFVQVVLLLREKGAFDEHPPGPSLVHFEKVGKATVGIPMRAPDAVPVDRPSVASTLLSNVPQIISPSYVRNVGSSQGVDLAKHVVKPKTVKRDARPLREASAFFFDDDYDL